MVVVIARIPAASVTFSLLRMRTEHGPDGFSDSRYRAVNTLCTEGPRVVTLRNHWIRGLIVAERNRVALDGPLTRENF
jgi:hypothetical protein